MTRKRNDKHSTEFGLWLREQKVIESKKGYLASNLDFIWANWKNKKWLLIEEKRYMSDMKRWQREMFKTLHNAAKNEPNYKGFYFIQFEKTNPEDGRIYINYKEKTKQDLFNLLMFRS
ncbi:MAG: hypothetical protein HOJ31_06695 [Anaerolineae bacterium]|jgi:hypothetical protein|nr:hypothetical protein [Anaerolineae bacterium]